MQVIFSHRSHNVCSVNRCFEVGGVRYRDSKYSIGLHKIDVKLFARPFDQPLFEGCGYMDPDREDKVVAQGEMRSESTTGFPNR